MYPLGISYISPCFNLICKDSTTLPRTLPNLFSSRLKRKGRAKFRPKGTTRLVNRQEFDAFFNVPWARWVRFFNRKFVGIVFEWFFLMTWRTQKCQDVTSWYQFQITRDRPWQDQPLRYFMSSCLSALWKVFFFHFLT